MDFTDPNLDDEAKGRLGGQNALVLARLRRGPATNIELEKLSGSRRINSRVADVRRHLRMSENSTIVCRAIDVSRGLFAYRIVSIPGWAKDATHNS